MKINTRDFGEVEISDNTIIDFPEGILGFENSKRYTLLCPLGDGIFPMWLQSVDETEPCFVVYDAMQICPDYKFQISDEEQQMLKLEDENTPYCCLAVAIVPDDYLKTTINLRCPIVLNTRDNVAAQIILDDYDFKIPVYSEEA